MGPCLSVLQRTAQSCESSCSCCRRTSIYRASTARPPPTDDYPSTSKRGNNVYDSAEDEEEDDLDYRSIIQGLAGAYKVLQLLGTGAEGTTYLVEDVADGKRWAIKLIKLPLPTRYVEAITREIKLQSELGEGHRNIVTTEEVVLTSHYLGLVMDFAAGGALTTFLADRFRQNRNEVLLLQEDEARYLFRQIANAVDFCHRYKVVHRDLKLDNILITHHDPPIIKLCDFGFARGWNKSSHFTTVIGTPDYMSPQITADASGSHNRRQGYDGTKADVWAMGVLLYVMLIGKFPFEGSCVSEMPDGDQSSDPTSDIMRKIFEEQIKGAWKSHPQVRYYLPHLSPEVQDLLDKMFELDENKRIDVATIKQHPWLQMPLQPEHHAAILQLEKDQAIIDQNVLAGSYCSKRRNQAIDDLLALAAREEFKQRASAPITARTTFQIWSRICLKTEMAAYFVPNKKTLQQLIAESDKLSTRFTQSRSMMETAQSPRTVLPSLLEAPGVPSTIPELEHECSMPQPSNQPSKAIFRPRPDLGFRSMMHGSGGEKVSVGKPKRPSMDVSSPDLSHTSPASSKPGN